MSTTALPLTQGRTAGGWGTTLLLVALLTLPTVLSYTNLASSMAAGTALVTFVMATRKWFRGVPSQLPIGSRITAKVIVLLVLLHLIVASLFSPVNFTRGLSSLVLLWIALTGAAALADIVAMASGDTLLRVGRRLLYLMWLIGLMGTLGIGQVASGDHLKPFLPFTEPSLFALVVAPILIFNSVATRGIRRYFFIGSFMIFAGVVQNFTLIVVCILAILVCMRLRYVPILALLAIPAILQVDLSYYLDRIDFSSASRNLSALVFLQGWQFVPEALTRTHLVGYGFQQLGQVESGSSASFAIYALVGQSLNTLDGGFNFAKLVSEFGVVGMVLAGGYVVTAFKAICSLRAAARKQQCYRVADVFAASVIASYLVEMFVRGSGYFTPTGIMLLASLNLWYRRHITG
jgi:hypothetical protein